MVAALLPLFVSHAGGRPQYQHRPTFTIPEYNAFQKAFQNTGATHDPQVKVKLLDEASAEFVAQYPNSLLMAFVYQQYCMAYFQLRDYPNAIAYADKLVGLGERVDTALQIQALQVHVQSFAALSYDPKAADANEKLAMQRDTALRGVMLLQRLSKPVNYAMTDEEFAQLKEQGIALFNLAAPPAVTGQGLIGKTPSPKGSTYDETIQWLQNIESIEVCGKCPNRAP